MVSNIPPKVIGGQLGKGTAPVNTNFAKIGGAGGGSIFTQNANASQYGGMGNATNFARTNMAENDLKNYLDSFQATEKKEPGKTKAEKWANALGFASAGVGLATAGTALATGVKSFFGEKSDGADKTSEKTETKSVDTEKSASDIDTAIQNLDEKGDVKGLDKAVKSAGSDLKTLDKEIKQAGKNSEAADKELLKAADAYNKQNKVVEGFTEPLKKAEDSVTQAQAAFDKATQQNGETDDQFTLRKEGLQQKLDSAKANLAKIKKQKGIEETNLGTLSDAATTAETKSNELKLVPGQLESKKSPLNTAINNGKAELAKRDGKLDKSEKTESSKTQTNSTETPPLPGSKKEFKNSLNEVKTQIDTMSKNTDDPKIKSDLKELKSLLRETKQDPDVILSKANEINTLIERIKNKKAEETNPTTASGTPFNTPPMMSQSLTHTNLLGFDNSPWSTLSK